MILLPSKSAAPPASLICAINSLELQQPLRVGMLMLFVYTVKLLFILSIVRACLVHWRSLFVSPVSNRLHGEAALAILYQW